jgi:hypothetical protein
MVTDISEYLVYIVYLLPVSATLMAILREVHYRRYITKIFEPVHCFKTYPW